MKSKKLGLLGKKEFQDYLQNLPTVRHTQLLVVEDGVVVGEVEAEQTGDRPPKVLKSKKED